MEQIGFFTGCARLDTTARSTLACIFQCLAHPHLLLNDDIRIKERGITHSVAYNTRCGAKHAIRRPLADLNIPLGLKQAQFVKHFQGDIGYFVGPIRAVAKQSPQIDVGEIVVRSALRCGNTHLGRCRSVVDLNPQTGEKLLCLIPVDGSGRKIPLIKRTQMLIQVSGALCVPTVQLRN